MAGAKSRRSYGTGSLYVRVDSNGRETWYGHWRSNDRQVKRRIGPKRADGARDGLIRAQAEAELRRLMAEVSVEPLVGERRDVADVARCYLIHAERRGRKASTRKNVESEARVHLAPFFGSRSMDAIRPQDVLEFVTVLERKGLSPKSIRNVIGTLSALFNFARSAQRRWATITLALQMRGSGNTSGELRTTLRGTGDPGQRLSLLPCSAVSRDGASPTR